MLSFRDVDGKGSSFFHRRLANGMDALSFRMDHAGERLEELVESARE